MGKPAATARPYLRSLSHSFTLDFVVLCNGTKAQAHAMKEELGGFLRTLGLTLSVEKTKITRNYPGRLRAPMTSVFTACLGKG
jgi:hypothetical protein